MKEMNPYSLYEYPPNERANMAKKASTARLSEVAESETAHKISKAVARAELANREWRKYLLIAVFTIIGAGACVAALFLL
jgi:hypothetical protein